MAIVIPMPPCGARRFAARPSLMCEVALEYDTPVFAGVGAGFAAEVTNSAERAAKTVRREQTAGRAKDHERPLAAVWGTGARRQRGRGDERNGRARGRSQGEHSGGRRSGVWRCQLGRHCEQHGCSRRRRRRTRAQAGIGLATASWT